MICESLPLVTKSGRGLKYRLVAVDRKLLVPHRAPWIAEATESAISVATFGSVFVRKSNASLFLLLCLLLQEFRFSGG